jgi:FHA domain
MTADTPAQEADPRQDRDHALDTAKITAPEYLILECVGKEFYVPLGKDYVVGRSTGEVNAPQPDIALNPYGTAENGVSRCHVLISGTDYTIYVSDLNSTNGTWLNGKRLAPNRKQLLNGGDELRLGKLSMIVKF